MSQTEGDGMDLDSEIVNWKARIAETDKAMESLRDDRRDQVKKVIGFMEQKAGLTRYETVIEEVPDEGGAVTPEGQTVPSKLEKKAPRRGRYVQPTLPEVAVKDGEIQLVKVWLVDREGVPSGGQDNFSAWKVCESARARRARKAR